MRDDIGACHKCGRIIPVLGLVLVDRGPFVCPYCREPIPDLIKLARIVWGKKYRGPSPGDAA
jgi:hypothetical protein